MNQFQIKICGNREPESSRMVAGLEPDHMGWIFSAQSKRQISILAASSIIEEIDKTNPAIKHWAVFARNSLVEIEAVFAAIPELAIAQIVADADFCKEVRSVLPVSIGVVPAIRVKQKIEPGHLSSFPKSPFYIMDAFVTDVYGGTGKRLDPELLSAMDQPYFLAGGLNADNVIQAIQECGVPIQGVDVSSGVEGKFPGVKDELKINKFIQNARRAFDL